MALQSTPDEFFLKAPEGLELRGDGVEDHHHPFAQLAFHGADRGTCAVVEIIVVGDARRRRRALLVVITGSYGLGVGGLAGHGLVGERLCNLAAVGLLQIDDLAQQDATAGQLFAPDHDRFEGQGAFAKPPDHGVAAGLDALGDGDFALARKQLNRAHLAQVHPDRIVSAVIGALFVGAFGDRGLFAHGHFAAFGLGRVFLGFNDVDAHLREHGEGVLDGFGGDFLGRQDLVQLVHGDVAAGLGLLDELLDPRIGQVEERTVAHRLLGGLGRGGFAHLALRIGRGPHARSAPKMVYGRRPSRALPSRRPVACPNRSRLNRPSQCVAFGFQAPETGRTGGPRQILFGGG